MDKLLAMTTFVRIVERGSLTAAAGVLGTSLPSVVRRLAELETMLGARLLNRTTRSLSLTDEGREYHERSVRVLADIEEAESAIAARRTEPRGRLRITAPVMFGRLRVAPVVMAFLGAHPHMQIELLLTDRIVDVVEEGLDVGVRIAQLPDSSLVAVAVGHTRRVVCASPAYLKRAGTPKLPRHLSSHACIASSTLGETRTWSFGGSPPQRVAVHPLLVTNQIDAAIDACRAGLGCVQALRYQVHGALEDRTLVRLLARFEPEPLPIQLVYPHARLLSANVRAFADFAVPRLRASLQEPGARVASVSRRNSSAMQRKPARSARA
jgi:DNA-binding transcriptional LysR family regulator